MELTENWQSEIIYMISMLKSEIPWVAKIQHANTRVTMAADIMKYWFFCECLSWVNMVAMTEPLTVSQRHTGPRLLIKRAAAFCLHTNGGNIPQHLSGCRAKRAPWKQLPRGRPSGRRDTACQDFQRGGAENSIRQQWLISLLQLPECPNFRYFFPL